MHRWSRTSDRASWVMILAMVLAFAGVSWTDPFRVDPVKAILPVLGLLVLLATLIAGRRLVRPRLTAAATAFLQMTLFTILGVILAYAIAAQANPLWDPQFARLDQALGFNWPAIRSALDAVPLAVVVLGIAYHSLVVQMIVAIVALSEAGRLEVLRITVAAAISSGFVTILLSSLLPAIGNLYDPAHYRHLWPSIAWLELELINGLRDGSRRVLNLSAMTGIVSFPSFHATLAVIFIWAFRHLPRFAIPGGLWAGVTIVATPVFGGHYAVDVIAGVLLAPPSIFLARHLVRWRPTGDEVLPRSHNPAIRRAAPALPEGPC